MVRLSDQRLAEVQEKQRPIAEWLQAVMRDKGITSAAWAKKAGMGRGTVSRAIRDDYPFVMSARSIIQLAKAVGVAPPIELGSQDGGIPSGSEFAAILGVILELLVPEREWPQEVLLPLGKALRHTLIEIAEEDGDPLKAARIAARQQLDEDT